ncbi:MAG: hypothetical protein QM662_05950 [Gordonia sp. (in: high G+C Gram-positive bacteria)]
MTHHIGNAGHTDDAWRAFTTDLTTRLQLLEPGTFIEIATVDAAGYHLLIVFTVVSGKVRGTIDALAESRITGPVRPGSADLGRTDMGSADLGSARSGLANLGWRRMPRRGQAAERGRRRVDELAQLTADTLHRVFGISDPSSLTLRCPFQPDSPPTTPPQRHLSAVPDISAPADDAQAAVLVRNPEQLLDLARRTLSECTHRELRVDADQTIELPITDAARTLVSVAADGPRLIFTTTLSHRVTDVAALGRLLTEYSARFPAIAFTTRRDHVYAQRTVECTVFHPRNLCAAHRQWREFIDTVATEITASLNTNGPGAHNCALSSLPVGLQTLIDLLFDGALTAARIAHLTNHNRERLQEYLAACSVEEIDWLGRRAAAIDEGAPAAEIRVYEEGVELFRYLGALIEEAIADEQR